MTWEDTTPFPGNAIYAGRLTAMRKEWGGYVNALVGSPAIFDNSANAYPEFPPETLFVGDANHRRALAAEDGVLGVEFLADLYRGLSRAEMHRIRRALNDRRTVRPSEGFVQRMEEGDLQKRALLETVEALGWRIDHKPDTHVIPYTNELEWIWRRDHGAVTRAILTYEGAFGPEPDKSQAKIIKGLGAFWLKYPDADFDRLVKAASSVRGKDKDRRSKIEAIVAAGKNQRDNVTFIKNWHDGIRYVLAMEYNRAAGRGRAQKLVV